VQGLGRRCIWLASRIRDVWVDSSVVLPVVGQTPKRVLRGRATPILEGEGLDSEGMSADLGGLAGGVVSLLALDTGGVGG